jgi:hypothetical protein
MCQLPALVLGLRPEGLMKVHEGKRTTGEKTENEAVNLPLHFNELADSGPEPTLNDPSDGNDNLPSYLTKKRNERLSLSLGTSQGIPKIGSKISRTILSPRIRLLDRGAKWT